MRFINLFAPRKQQTDPGGLRRRPPGGFAPRLELLEDRTVPSTLTVLNNLDKGVGSLRDAVAHARDGDTIVFAPNLSGQTITLTSGALDVKDSVVIDGPGADRLAISGNDTSRVFDIGAGLSVTIMDLTITRGRGVGSWGGGAIVNVGSALTLVNDVFSANRAVGSNVDGHSMGGGAITNRSGGALTIRASSFIDNQAVGREGGFGEGGAIWNHRAVALITDSTFSGNRAQGGDGGRVTGGANIVGEANGGAIFNQSGATLTVANTVFTGNESIGGNGGSGAAGASGYIVGTATGGAITNALGATIVVSGCTFAHNRAVGGSNATGGASGEGRVGNANGGGLANLAGAVATVTDSTFDHNEALGGSGNRGGGGTITFNRGAGGAISNVNVSFVNADLATLTVSDSTFTNNQAVGGAGGAGSSVAGPGVGGGIATLLGAVTTVTGSTFDGNQAIGGAGGFSGNGFGGGIYNDGRSTLEVRSSTIIDNRASGAGSGVGGGLYLAPGGSVCLDEFTIAHLFGNDASTGDDVFGDFIVCP